MFKKIRIQNRTYNYTYAYSFSLYVLHFVLPIYVGGGDTGWRSLLRHCATSRKVAGSIPVGVLEFFIVIILPTHNGPGVDSASNRNEYQEYFLGGKGGRCVGLTTLPPSWNLGSLKLLEPSGPVQACNWIVLRLLLFITGTRTNFFRIGPHNM